MKVSLALAVLVLVGLAAAACSVDLLTAPEAGDTQPDESQPKPPPDVDMTLHDVPLDEIHFGTFDGGSVPLSESTPELRARLLDAIPPIDNPVYGDAGEGVWLDGDDLVLGYVAEDRAYAYPFKILNFHEIVNDEINGVPVLVSYCPLCRSGIVYDRRVNGQVLSFGNTSALYESDLVMVDRSTGSYWYQVAGSAIVGPLTGAELELLPSSVATWQQWRNDHPDTLILTRDTGYSRPYHRDSFALYGDTIDQGRFAFPVGEGARDDRLRPSELVVGIHLDGVTRAYPVERITEATNDVVGGKEVVVIPIEGGATVFSAVVGDQDLRFQSVGEEIADVETGSVWDSSGVAVSGDLAGTALDPIPARTTFWFALVGAFPEVEVYSTP